MTHLTPDPQPRPKFAHWMFERGLKPRDVCKPLGCSHEQVRRVCLPYDDPDHRRASDRLRQKIAVFTRGDIDLQDWDAPPARPYRARIEGVAL